MNTLFLDTSYNQVFGVIDADGAWIGKHVLTGQRSSQFHAEVHALCESMGMRPSDFTRVLYSAGPGFYTGLRVAYGVAQMLKLEGVQLCGFLNHDVPAAAGHGNYAWVTKAYRGEVFVHRREDGHGRSCLMPEDVFLKDPLTDKVFIHHPSAVEGVVGQRLLCADSTEQMILTGAGGLLARLGKGSEIPLHYFRAPEDEFRPNP